MKRTLVIVVLLALACGLIWRLSRPQTRQTGTGTEPAPEDTQVRAAETLSPALLVEVPEEVREPASERPEPTDRHVPERRVPEVQEARGPIEGLLLVPEAWGRAHVRVELHLVSQESSWSEARELYPLPHAPGFFPFAFHGRLPGEYRLQVPELEHLTNFVVAPGGRTDLRIEVPPPRIVLVRAFDAASGAERTPAEVEVRWRGVQSQGGFRTLRPASWDETRRAWCIVAARGALELTARGKGYLETREELEDDEGPREVRLELAAAYELVLELRRDGAVVGWDPSLRPRLVPAGGQPDHVSVALADNRCRLVQRAGGPYLLEVDTPAGYRTIAPLLLELGSQHTHHTVELVSVR